MSRQTKKISQATFDEMTKRHKLWLQGHEGGRRAIFTGLNLTAVRMELELDLRYAIFSCANLRSVDFNAACLDHAIFEQANMWDAGLENCSCAHAQFKGVKAVSAAFDAACMAFCDFEVADLRKACFEAAMLDCANFRGAVVSGATFEDTDLSRACLEDSGFHACAAVRFAGHGECGRTLLAYQVDRKSEIKFQCGCFYGSETDLRNYIEDGHPSLVPSRLKALDTVLELIKIKPVPRSDLRISWRPSPL